MAVSSEPAETAPGLLAIGLLAIAMGAALFPVIGLAVLSRSILVDLDISRTQLGLAITAGSATSAGAAIALGRFSDRQGGRNALATVFLLGGLASVGIAIGPSYLVLLASAAIAGLAMGSANPATNRFVVETVPRRQWGTITGVKLAGEAFAIVVGGALLPIAALAIGWRLAFGLSALIPAVAIALVLATIPGKASPTPAATAAAARGSAQPLDRNIPWLVAYSLVVGLAGGSVATYLPLYAQEALGMTPSSAGFVVAIMGGVAVIGRLVWGHYAQGSDDLRGRFLSMALLAVGAILLLWSASVFDATLVWLGAAAWGISLLSIGVIGNLAVMAYSGVENTGRASGFMITGFGAGLMVGPPVFGWTVDTTGAYDLGFGLLAVELIILTAIGFLWGRRP